MTTCTTCPRPITDTAFGDTVCTAELARSLDELAALLPEVGITVAKLARLTSGGVRPAGAEPQLPYDAGAAERGRALQGELVTWARLVHEESGRPLPASPSGSGLARYLGQAVEWARYRQFWPELHAALMPLSRAASRLVDRPADRVYLGPCGADVKDQDESCRADVYARPQAAVGTCKACGATHEVATSRQWLLGALEGVLARPVEIAGVLRGFGHAKVGYSTIASYVASGRLQPRGTDQAGRPRYRVGDVLDLRYPDRNPTRQGDQLAS
ncbi:hypothetical protein [Actinoplanes sp. N902-109]|uniref:hypothetical protein n=1 Tax=Actinoplanes sp. (strain N902-109) TaxID=649831 RepID=UPI0003294E93|nr:hypothetical protein [Actinoplanes sp. N902-109]AGL13862.1 hypothetical protein L083_0352 [Actinoplanes sp. N902-109]